MKIRRNLSRCFGSSILPALLLLSAAATPRLVRAGDAYVLTDLGSLPGGTGAYANSVNNLGQVVGFVLNESTSYPVLFSGTGSNNLNLGLSNGTLAQATDINDAGQIVGYTALEHDNATFFSGTGSNNTVFNPSASYLSVIRAINRNGVAVGSSYHDDDEAPHATRFAANGSSSAVGKDPSSYGSSAAAINAGGTVVGQAIINSHYRATVFTDGGDMDLGALGTGTDKSSYAYGINDAGTIVGAANTERPGETHAAIFSGTGTNNTDLGTLGAGNSSACAVNNAGLVVGNSQYDASQNVHGFIYQNGVMTDLNTLVVNQSRSGLTNLRLNTDGANRAGRCLNEVGQIAAIADGPGGVHAVLLTPQPFFQGATPLPDGMYYRSFPNGNFFGYYSYLTDPRYVYHLDLGYEYWFNAADGQSGIYFYDFASRTFFYTSPSFGFPYLYDFSLNTMLYYYPDPSNPGRYNTNGVRYFYNFATGQIITK